MNDYATLKITIEAHGRHIHNYANTATGNWSWCPECQCFIVGKCDHRRRMCRDRKRQVAANGSRNENTNP